MIQGRVEITLRDHRNSALWSEKKVMQNLNDGRVLVRLRANNTTTLDRGE